MILQDIEFGEAYILKNNRIIIGVLEKCNGGYADDFVRIVGVPASSLDCMPDPITGEALINVESWVRYKATNLLKALL